MIKEIKNLSKWFKILYFILFAAYISAWLFTIHLSNLQKDIHLRPILPVVQQDSEEYYNLSESIISGEGFVQNGVADTLRLPGYPSFVALLKYITGSYFAVTLAQIILVFLSALIIRRLGIFFRSQKAGEIAALFFLINPLVITLSLIILTDILFLFLLLLGFYLAISSKVSKTKAIIASILFALAVYVRSMGIFALPIFIAPFLASESNIKEKFKFIFFMIMIVVLAVLPWICRNYKLTGVADLTSFKAINLIDYAAPMYLSNQNHTTLDEERANLEKSTGIPMNKWRDLRYSNQLTAAALKIILGHPFSYLKYHIVSSLPFLFSFSIQDTLITYRSAMHISGFQQTGAINYLASHNWKLFLASITAVWWKIAERLFWLVVYVIALWGVWKEKKNKATWAFVFVPAYLMLLAGPAANARYAIQGLPFILLLFSAGLIDLKYKIKNKAARPN